VVDGASLADSMAKSPDTFPRVYIAMVQAGETGGFLDLVLAQIADFQAREKDLRSKVMAAMLYPCILLVLALGVLVFLLTFFIPKFQVIFSGLGAALPLPTQIVLATSHIMRSYGLFVIVGLVVAGLLVRSWAISEKGRRAWEVEEELEEELEGVLFATPGRPAREDLNVGCWKSSTVGCWKSSAAASLDSAESPPAPSARRVDGLFFSNPPVELRSSA